MDLPIPAPKIVRLGRLHGVEDVRVFGSFARGTARTGSDLDLLVRFEQGRSLLDLVGFKQDLEDVGACPVDVVTEGALHPALRVHILAEAVPLVW